PEVGGRGGGTCAVGEEGVVGEGVEVPRAVRGGGEDLHAGGPPPGDQVGEVVDGDDRQVEEGPGGGPDHLGVVHLDAPRPEHDGVRAGGVGGADDGAQVAGVGGPGEHGDEPGQ